MSRLAFCLSLLGAAPAVGQSFDEAVRINVMVGTRTCVDAMLEGYGTWTLFGTAGFEYRRVNQPTNSFGVTPSPRHYFDAPADTAKVQVLDPEAHPGICNVLTTHLNEAQVNALVTDVLFRTHPGAQVNGPDQWIISYPNQLPLIISVNTIGNNNKFEAPGTVQVSMTFPG